LSCTAGYTPHEIKKKVHLLCVEKLLGVGDTESPNDEFYKKKSHGSFITPTQLLLEIVQSLELEVKKND